MGNRTGGKSPRRYLYDLARTLIGQLTINRESLPLTDEERAGGARPAAELCNFFGLAVEAKLGRFSDQTLGRIIGAWTPSHRDTVVDACGGDVDRIKDALLGKGGRALLIQSASAVVIATMVDVLISDKQLGSPY